jgi:hypothetical protein
LEGYIQQEDHLGPGVPGHPGPYTNTPIIKTKKKKKKKKKNLAIIFLNQTEISKKLFVCLFWGGLNPGFPAHQAKPLSLSRLKIPQKNFMKQK